MTGESLNLLLRHVRKMAACSGEGQATDRLLLGRFVQSREDGAFAELARRHGPMVWGVCRGVLRNWHDAEDAFQATFLVLARKAASIRRPEALAGWLHGVAYHLACKAQASATRRVGRISNPSYSIEEQRKEDMPANDPLLDMTCRELQRTVHEELARLPDKYRVPLVLCYLEGKRQEDAARELGCSAGALRGRLNRGRERLRQRLLKRGLTVSSTLVAGVLTQTANATVPVALVKTAIHAGLLVAAGKSAAGVVAGRAALLADGAIQAMFAGKVKFGLVLFMVFGLAGLGLTAAGRGARDEGRGAGEDEQVVSLPPPPAPHGPRPSALPPRSSSLAPSSRLGTARYRHGSPIESMAVSADGRLVATSSGFGLFSPARVFDLTDGRCLYSLPLNAEAVGLSPDGKTLAIRDDEFLYVRDAATGKVLRKLKYMSDSGGGRSVTDWMTFTPDGKQLAATLMGDAVQLIDVETCKVIRTFAPDGASAACVFSTDGKLMATGGYEQDNGVYYARLWEVATGKELRRFAIGHEPPIGALAFAHDGKALAGGCWGDGRLRLFEVATGKELKVFAKIGEDIRGIAFAPDGKTVAAAGNSIHLYDPATGKERLRIDRKARTLAFSRDSSVLTGAVSGAIYRWDAAGGRQLTPAAAQDSAVEQILVSADGRQVFTTDQDGDLHVWDAAGGKSPRRIVGGIEKGVVASPDGRFLAWTVADDTVRITLPAQTRGNQTGSRVRLYDIASHRVIDRFPAFASDAIVAGFLPDGNTLLTLGGGVATVRLWDITSGKERRSFPVSPTLDAKLFESAKWAYLRWTTRRAALSNDGKTLAIGLDWGLSTENRSAPVRLWDVPTGNARHELNEPIHVLEVADEDEPGSDELSQGAFNRRSKSADGRAFSPDGRLLIDWAENPLGRSRIDHVYVWDATTGRAVATLAASPRSGATNAAFAPDGRTLATASADGIVRLWETATWKVRTEFRGHRDRVTALAFGPDGRLFTGGLDTIVLGWDVRPPREPAKGTLADAWDALTSYDARAGFQAQGRFLAEPVKAVEWFASRLTPAIRPDPSSVKALIADLEKDDFATRARATAALKEQWPATAAALRAAAAKPSSLEAGRRAEGIIGDMSKAITPPGALRALRATEVLEWIATKEARTLLLELAKGAPDARLTRDAAAACRRLGEGR